MDDFLKGISLGDQKKYMPLLMYKEMLAEINNYPPVQMVDIGAFIQIITVSYLYLKIMKDVCGADSELVNKLKERIDKKLQQALGEKDEDIFGKDKKE